MHRKQQFWRLSKIQLEQLLFTILASKMSCTEEEALEISKDFLIFAKEVEQKNAAKRKEQPEPEKKDPLENLCKLLEKLVLLTDENRFLKNRVDFLERQDELQRIIIRSTFVGQRREKKTLQRENVSLDHAHGRSDRDRRRRR